MKLVIDKYNAFFFDFDGVIADTTGIKTEAFGELFRDYGPDIMEKVIDYHLVNTGVSRYEKFRYYYYNLLNQKITPEIMKDLDRRFSQIVLNKVVNAPFVKNVTEFIEKLNEAQKKCFIVSATPQKEIRRIVKLKQISCFFREIVGSPKNKEKNLEYLVKKYNIHSTRAIFFGDSKSDYEAALQNNVYFVGIVNTKSKELGKLNCIPKIKNFSSLEIV